MVHEAVRSGCLSQLDLTARLVEKDTKGSHGVSRSSCKRVGLHDSCVAIGVYSTDIAFDKLLSVNHDV
jgi:hypothetical protein